MKKIFFLTMITLIPLKTSAMISERTFSESDLSLIFFNVAQKVEEAKQCIRKAYKDPNQSLQDFTNEWLRGEQGLEQAWKPQTWRADYKEVESLIVTEICGGRISETSKTVEIGAGALTDGKSYLTSRLPKKVANIIEKTD